MGGFVNRSLMLESESWMFESVNLLSERERPAVIVEPR
jgi:hypothetical protein